MEGLPDTVASPAATGDNDNLLRDSEHYHPPQNELVYSPKPVLGCRCCYNTAAAVADGAFDGWFTLPETEEVT